MENVFAEINARQKALLQYDTWGHLAPNEKQIYKGYIIFILTDWGNIEPYIAEFKGLDMSPWFFSHINNYISEYIMNNCSDKNHGIWRFDGEYIFTNYEKGEYNFDGEVKEIKLN